MNLRGASNVLKSPSAGGDLQMGSWVPEADGKCGRQYVEVEP